MSRRKCGFTLLELLITIALMVVLAGLLIPAFNKARLQGKIQKAATDARILESAIQAYRSQEGHYPAPLADLRDGIDRAYGVAEVNTEENRYVGGDEILPSGNKGNNSIVVNILRDADPPVFEPGKLSIDDQGNVLDPWRRQYRIWLDLDENDFINWRELGSTDGDIEDSTRLYHFTGYRVISAGENGVFGLFDEHRQYGAGEGERDNIPEI